MIKMVNEFKLTVVHFGFTAGQKNCGKPGLGHRAAGPPLRAAGPSGLRAVGPSRAVGREPLGRGPAFSKTLSDVVPPTQKVVEKVLIHV